MTFFMRTAILTFLLAIHPAWAQNNSSIIFAGAQGASATIPKTAPFTSITNMRIEFRISRFALNQSGRQRVFISSSVSCAIMENSENVACTDYYEKDSPSFFLSLKDRTDVIIRLQKVAGKDETFELWNADLSGYAISYKNPVATTPRNWSGPLAFGFEGEDNPGTYFRGQLAYWRWYSSVVTVGTAPLASPGGDLADFEFEGNGNDSSKRLTLKLTGNPGYGPTPFFVLLGNDFTVRAQRSFVLDGSSNGAASYAWKQLSGPTDCRLSSPTASAPVVTNCVEFGERTFELTASSASGEAGKATIRVGVVPTTPTGVVKAPDTTWDAILGPLLIDGESPWPWFESQRKSLSAYFYSSPTAAPGGAWVASMGTSQENLLYYDSPLALYRQYYRTGLAKYQTWARDLAKFTYAMPDGWNNGRPAGGCGSNWNAPRDSVAAGLMAYAYDRDPSMFTCLQSYVDYMFSNYLEQRDKLQGYAGPYYGLRESGYTYYFGVILSQIHPDRAIRAQWTTRIANEYANYWRPLQCGNTLGFQPVGCDVQTTKLSGTVSYQPGNKTVTGTNTRFTSEIPRGITRVGLTSGGTGYTSAPQIVLEGCENYSLTATVSEGSVTALQIVTPGTCSTSTRAYGIPIQFKGGGGTGASGWAMPPIIWLNSSNPDCASVSGGCQPYVVGAVLNDTTLTLTTATDGNFPAGMAYIDRAGGPSAIGGYRWADGGWAGYAEQIWHVTIAAEGIARYYDLTKDPNALATLQALALHIVRDTVANPQCAEGITLRSVKYAQYTAPGDYGGACPNPGDIYAGRALLNTVPHLFGWLYRWTQDSQWLAAGDNFFGALFGEKGPGPGADGYFGQFDAPYGAKFYGQSLRSADSYLANRLGKPVETDVFVAKIANAASNSEGPVSPGEFVAAYGPGIGPAISAAVADSAVTELLTVRIGDQICPVLYASPNQINFQVPYETTLGAFQRLLITSDNRSVDSTVDIQAIAPGLFTVDNSGLGQIVAWVYRADAPPFTNDSLHPARASDALTFFLTGEGDYAPFMTSRTGTKASGSNLPTMNPLPVVTLGGKQGEVLYAGPSPGSYWGILQVNVRVPPDASSGPSIPISVSIGGVTSTAGTTLALE